MSLRPLGLAVLLVACGGGADDSDSSEPTVSSSEALATASTLTIDGPGLSFTAPIESMPVVAAPRDLATGQASGKRQWAPIRVRKETGPATAQLTAPSLQHVSLTTMKIVDGQRTSTFSGARIEGIVIHPGINQETITFSYDAVIVTPHPAFGSSL